MAVVEVLHPLQKGYDITRGISKAGGKRRTCQERGMVVRCIGARWQARAPQGALASFVSSHPCITLRRVLGYCQLAHLSKPSQPRENLASLAHFVVHAWP